MMYEDITNRYLKEVILFKERQELHGDFLDESARTKLLKKLFDTLDFDKNLWDLRLENAKQAFLIFKQLDDDNRLRDKYPKHYSSIKQKYILQAIALDPFNEKYLQKYLLENRMEWKPKKELAIHYALLYHPNSSEFQNALVDLKITQHDITYDYLSDVISAGFVNELVFMQEELLPEKNAKASSQELEKIALNAGIKKQMLDDMQTEVPDLLKSTCLVFDNHWLNWDIAAKAHLSIEKALGFAPYNEEVLATAILFYSKFYWRAILGYVDIKGDTKGNEYFLELIFGEKKPKSKRCFAKATEIMQDAMNLKSRYLLIVEENRKNPLPKVDEFGRPYTKLSGKFKMGMHAHKWYSFEEDEPEYILASLKKEIVTFQILSAHFKLQKNNIKIVLFSAVPIVLAIFVISYLIFHTLFPFFPLFILAFFVPLGLLGLKEKIWQNRKLNFENTIDFSDLKY